MWTTSWSRVSELACIDLALRTLMRIFHYATVIRIFLSLRSFLPRRCLDVFRSNALYLGQLLLYVKAKCPTPRVERDELRHLHASRHLWLGRRRRRPPRDARPGGRRSPPCASPPSAFCPELHIHTLLPRGPTSAYAPTAYIHPARGAARWASPLLPHITLLQNALSACPNFLDSTDFSDQSTSSARPLVLSLTLPYCHYLGESATLLGTP